MSRFSGSGTNCRTQSKNDLLEFAVLEAVTAREAVLALNDPDAVMLADALLCRLGQIAKERRLRPSTQARMPEAA